MKHLADVPYLGGIGPDRIAKEKSLAKALRHASAWANRNRDRRERIVITNYSCNGAFESVYPFLPEGAVVEPEQSWDEPSWYEDDEEERYLLWSAQRDDVIEEGLTLAEARARVEASEAGTRDLAAFREWTDSKGDTHRLFVADATDGAYWRLRRRPLQELFPGVRLKVAVPTPTSQSERVATIRADLAERGHQLPRHRRLFAAEEGEG